MRTILRILVIGAIVIVMPVLVFIGLYSLGYRIYQFPGHSMQPTIRDSENFVGRLSTSYRKRIERFDIAIYQSNRLNPQIYAKRVIGLSGERVIIAGDSIAIDGAPIALPQALDRTGLKSKRCDVTVPKDAIFILGDYTSDSVDSRWTGPIWKDDIIGYVVFKK